MKKLSKLIPDYYYLKRRFKKVMNQSLDLNDPRTFNEKLQWLKLYDRNPEYTLMVDKYNAKRHIAEKIGLQYIIPTLGVWDNFNDIPFDALPNQFVLKCTHDSGGLVICRDKSKLNIENVKKSIIKSLRNNYFWNGREWPYKNVRPRIIAEQYMAEGLRDYKALGFSSSPRMILVYSQYLTSSGLNEVFFDEVWMYGTNDLVCNQPIFPFKRPRQYELIKELINKISYNVPFNRVDFYEINENCYYGEISYDSKFVFDKIVQENLDLEFNTWKKLSGGYSININGILFVLSYEKSLQEIQKDLIDYKFFCFNGIADSVMVCTERETNKPKFYFFDKQWNLKKYNKLSEKVSDRFVLPKPSSIDRMFEISEKLSLDIPFVRVDLFCIDGLVYFGEMTFYPDSGFDNNILPEADQYLGDKLVLLKKGDKFHESNRVSNKFKGK